MMSSVLIALGSNLGDRRSHLRHAVSALVDAEHVEVTAVSNLYETAPVGGPDRQGAYLNAALAARTSLGANEMLALLHRIEAERERSREVRWGPRTLDLDLLVHDDLVIDDDSVVVPHPRLHERRFVLVPVCDIAPDLIHPRLGRSMRDLLDQVPREPGDLGEPVSDWVRIGPTTVGGNAP